MPDSLQRYDRGPPPLFLGPRGDRPDLLCDQQGVFLADPQNAIIGLNELAWGRGGPLARVQYAQRSQTRDL
jgi:hypothetical protein